MRKWAIAIAIGLIVLMGCGITDPMEEVGQPQRDKKYDRHEEDGGGGGGTTSPTSKVVRYKWGAPTKGTRAVRYTVNVEENMSNRWVEIKIVPDTFMTHKFDYGKIYRVRVAAIDDSLRQGPYSAPSDTLDLRLPDVAIDVDPFIHFELNKWPGASGILDMAFEGDTVHHLVIADRTKAEVRDGGVHITEPTIISGEELGREFVETVQASGEFTIVMEFQTASLDQFGPARIFTVSLDPYNRNMTVGQDGNKIDFRLRTTGTGDNGTPSTASSAVLTLERTELIITKNSSGNITIYLDGSIVASKQISGDMSNMNPSYWMAIGNELTEDRPWLGSIYRLEVYDIAVEPINLEEALDSSPRPVLYSK